MTKENAKDFLPLVQALADGKTIQKLRDHYFWSDYNERIDGAIENIPIENLRIKPEEEYIPFDTVEELIDCWNKKKYNGKLPYNANWEMPLIWVKNKTDGAKRLIIGFDDDCVVANGYYYTCDKMFETFTFLDGSPIGKIKE